jgi:hypothetical protein
MRYKVPVAIFLLIFIIFGLGELLFGAIFYDELSYLRTIIFALIAACLLTYVLLKSGDVKTLSDVLKYKKKYITISKKVTQRGVFLITETLKLNNYIVNTSKTTATKISFTTKPHLLDVGDIYTIRFKEDNIIIKSRPKIVVNITDTNRITSRRVKQIEEIVKQCVRA